MNGYLLAITVFVVTAGRLGDMFGRKRLFLAGTVVFALGSAVSGAAGDELTLIGGRVLQGIGAAPMLPLSLAIVCNVFPKEEQARALGIWAGISALALAIGPLAGGALVEVDWRRDLLDQPAGCGARRSRSRPLAAPESTDPGSGRADRPAGAARRSASGSPRWSSPSSRRGSGAPARRSPSSLVGPRLAATRFWRIEHRSPEPIVDFALFRNGPYFGASAAAFALVGAYWCVMFFQSQYLQDVRRPLGGAQRPADPADHGPDGLHLAASGRLIARFGARRLMTAGMGFAVLGLLVLTQIGADSSYGLLLAGYLPFGVALGFVYAPMSTAAMAAMPAEKVGIASGRAGDGPGDGGHARAGRDRRPLARAARRRQRLRRRDRRLDLDPRRALRGRHRAHLDVRPRCRPAAGTIRGTATPTSEARRRPCEQLRLTKAYPDLSTWICPDRIPERNLPS